MERFSIGGWIESSILLARRTAASDDARRHGRRPRIPRLAHVREAAQRGHGGHGGLKVAVEQAIPEGTAGESTFDRESFRTHLIELAAAGGHRSSSPPGEVTADGAKRNLGREFACFRFALSNLFPSG